MAAEATRSERYGSNARLDVGVHQQHRFTDENKALIKSLAAIELAQLLGKPDDHTARMCRAVEKFKFRQTDEYVGLRRALNQDKALTPYRREELKTALRKSCSNAQHAAWRMDRDDARWWVRLLRLYAAAREWLANLQPRARVAYVKKLERNLEKLARNFLPPSSKEEGRRRARNRRELRAHDKRQRRQFKWRASSGRQLPSVFAKSNGEYDPVEVAKVEYERLCAAGASGVSFAADGHRIKNDLISAVEKKADASVCEDIHDEACEAEALCDLLRLEVQKFKRKRNGIAN